MGAVGAGGLRFGALPRQPTQPGATLPDAGGVRARLEATEPHPVPASRRALPLAAVGLALAFALFGPPLLGTLAPWLALGGVGVAAVRRARRAKRLAAAVQAAEESLRLRRPTEAYLRADRLLPELVHEPGPSAQCVHLMARALQALGRPEGCLVATGVLLDRLPPNHPARAAVLLHRAVAEFESDRLADGDQTLGKLRASLDLRDTPPEPPEAEAVARGNAPGGEDAPHKKVPQGPERRVGRPLPAPDPAPREHAAAAYRLARLVQSALTYHAADAVADADAGGGPVACFRALGVEAGFAHGLLAWCHLKLHDAEAAAQAWARATRLVPAHALVHRFPRLAEVDAACPASPPLPA